MRITKPRRSFSPAILTALRQLPLDGVIARLAIYCKSDPTYVPLKDPRSRRWILSTTQGDFEILTTGSKWYDTRARRGGGGAIDLAIHLLQVPFPQAVKLLMPLLASDRGGATPSDPSSPPAPKPVTRLDAFSQANPD